MIHDPALAWTFTILFVATGLVSLVALLRSHAWSDRGSYLAHVVMSAAMAIMPWSWSMSIPALVQVVVFTIAALWYVGLAVLRPRTHAGPEASRHHSSAGFLSYHAAMMAAMAWMSVLMTLMMGGSTSGTHAHVSGMDMAGMDMSPQTIIELWNQPAWVIVITVGFVALFAAATIWFLIELVRTPRSRLVRAPLSPLVQTLLNLFMAVGMGASFLVMG